MGVFADLAWGDDFAYTAWDARDLLNLIFETYYSTSSQEVRGARRSVFVIIFWDLSYTVPTACYAKFLLHCLCASAHLMAA